MQKKISFASIGDCCVDIYTDTNQILLGGTAYNSALQAAKSNADVTIFSTLGNDSYADKYQTSLRSIGINTSHLKTMKGQTSRIKITLDTAKQPQYGAWKLGVLGDYQLSETDQQSLAEHDVLRMTFFKPLATLFEQFIKIKTAGLKVADFAGNSQYSTDIDIIKKYIHDLDIVIKSLDAQDTASLSFFKNISQQYPDKIMLVLLGSSGSLVYQNGKEYKQPAFTTAVINTTGAGDAYTAAFLVEYAQSKDIQSAVVSGTTAATLLLEQHN
ncbi:MAG: PfkB family carbohydrate kinase [Weeksellaceae bacterium]